MEDVGVLLPPSFTCSQSSANDDDDDGDDELLSADSELFCDRSFSSDTALRSKSSLLCCVLLFTDPPISRPTSWNGYGAMLMVRPSTRNSVKSLSSNSMMDAVGLMLRGSRPARY